MTQTQKRTKMTKGKLQKKVPEGSDGLFHTVTDMLMLDIIPNRKK